MSPERNAMDARLAVCRLAMFLALALLGAGLYSFQIVQADKYVQLASENRLRLIRILPPRGVIYDANGISLAESVRVFDIKGYPLDLRREGALDTIADIFMRHGIPLASSDLSRELERQFWAPYRAVTLARNLTLSQVADLVADADFPASLFPLPVWRRIYPAGPLAAHVTGHVGEITREELEAHRGEEYMGGEQIGKTGIELYYESRLRGIAGEEAIEVDARGRRLRLLADRSPIQGEDIHLTLDLGAQRVAADLMKERKGVLLAMDVRTGGIKVLYSSPTYDVNPLTWGVTPSEWKKIVDDPDRPMLNRAIGGNYPPGSIFKPIPAIAGLVEGLINARTQVFCPGSFTLGNRTFRCWQRWGHGSENVVRALRDSCDVFFYQLGLWLGIERLKEWSERFGLGSPTGIDLPGELAGNTAGREWKRKRFDEPWYQGDTVNYAIGQGFLLITPMQAAQFSAAFANGGFLVTPHFLKSMPTISRDLGLPKWALDLVQKGLLDVVHGGTGAQAGGFGVTVAGKTGTAQNPHGEDHAWFVGYAPAEAPRFVAVALVEGGGHGSSAAAPLVGALLASLCRENEEGGKRR